MADARPFHWEYHPEAPPPEAFRIEGGRPLRGTVHVSGAKNAALKLLAAAVLTGERCRFENVPEIEDVRVMTEVLMDLGVVVDHPRPGIYEVAAGDVDWQFIPLEAAAKMRASFILLGPLLARFGRVIISNPGGDRIGRRPGQPARRRDAGAGRRDRLPQRLLLRPGAGTAPRRRGHLPPGDRDGHRERDARRHPRRRPHGDPPRGAGAGGGRPHRLPGQDGRRRPAHRPRRDRGPRPPPPARGRPLA